MPTLSTQEIFDKAAAHLLKQGCQAKFDDGFCAYLTSNGNKCAIGALLPDGHAAQKSGQSVYGVCREYSDINEMLRGRDEDGKRLRFLFTLQNIHDNNNPDAWLGLLMQFARNNSLSDAVLEPFKPAAV